MIRIGSIFIRRNVVTTPAITSGSIFSRKIVKTEIAPKIIRFKTPGTILPTEVKQAILTLVKHAQRHSQEKIGGESLLTFDVGADNMG
jgi:hypothetical protein